LRHNPAQRHETDLAVSGVIVAVSAGPGRTLRDEPGRNSAYTAAFLRHIEEPEEIVTIFRHIKQDVDQATNQQQLPWVRLSIIREFYLRNWSNDHN
jgi:uncharacterized caspase-like protein